MKRHTKILMLASVLLGFLMPFVAGLSAWGYVDSADKAGLAYYWLCFPYLLLSIESDLSAYLALVTLYTLQYFVLFFGCYWLLRVFVRKV